MTAPLPVAVPAAGEAVLAVLRRLCGVVTRKLRQLADVAWVFRGRSIQSGIPAWLEIALRKPHCLQRSGEEGYKLRRRQAISAKRDQPREHDGSCNLHDLVCAFFEHFAEEIIRMKA
ncbi:hypothetical protein SDC9_156818 [bioreactor metagenome]|uniref:Uncharacterized protein n=1 Tax=bioreactor metagenome TaxID=1076179 RepID=A0A645F5R3_9ZZZZ